MLTAVLSSKRARRPLLIAAAVFLILGILAAVLHSRSSRRLSFALGQNEGSVTFSGAADGSPAGYGYGAFDANMAVTESARDFAAAPDMPPMAASYMPEPYPTAGVTAADVDQRIIKNGSLRLTVDSVSAALTQVADVAGRVKGFVQQSSSSERGDGGHEGYVTIRVPAAAFEQAMTDLKALANVVNDENTSGQDVTEQFTDLEAQLRNAKAQEEEYLKILKRAVSVEDVLKVQERLGYIRSQIESLEGRKQYLENVTAYSTISVSLTEEAVVRLPTKSFRPGAIVREAAASLVVLGQQAVAGLIWVVIVGGGLLLPILLLGLIILAIMKSRGKKR